MSEGRDGPMQAAQRLARPELPKRFYREARHAAAEGGFVLTLDERTARTPRRNLLSVPEEGLARALAAEWQAQQTVIDPARMPLTRIVNSAIDGVAARLGEVAAEIVAYAGTDLICYRADSPRGLVDRQAAAWDPLVAWVRATYGVRLILAEGVMHVAQDPLLAERIGAALAGADPFRLAAIHSATTLTGSAAIALALAAGALDPDAAWAAAHVDEDWQIAQWGEDAEAAARRAARRLDLAAAATILGR